jgi:hypothetical protein
MRVIFFTRRAGLSWTQGMCQSLIRVHPTRDFAFPFVTSMDGAGEVNP